LFYVISMIKFITTLSTLEIVVSFLLKLLLYWARGFTAFLPLRCVPSVFNTTVSFPFFRAVGCVSCSDLEICVNMVHRITTVTKIYQNRLCEMPYVPKTSFVRDSLGYRGEAIKHFLTFLFSTHAIGLQFLKDMWLRCNVTGSVVI